MSTMPFITSSRTATRATVGRETRIDDRTTLQGYHTVLLNSTVELPSEFTCKPQCKIAVCRVQTRRDYVAGAVAAVLWT